MKNVIATILLLAVLSISVFADDGNSPGGGRTCGAPGLPSCFASPLDPGKDESVTTKTIITVKNWLSVFFGYRF